MGATGAGGGTTAAAGGAAAGAGAAGFAATGGGGISELSEAESLAATGAGGTPPLAIVNKVLIMAESSPSGSTFVSETTVMMMRRASKPSKRMVTISWFKAIWPSRTLLNKVSQACANFSRRLNAKKPLLPLRVCIPRKIFSMSFFSSGFFSSSTKSISSWSRISPASITNSPRISSKLSST